MIDSALYVKRARGLVGSPYRHLGRTRRGIDCFGVMFAVYSLSESDFKEVEIARKTLGVYFSERRWKPDVKNPNHTQGMKLLLSALNNNFIKIEKKKALPGDILLMAFKSKSPEYGDHIAIYVDKNQMVHSDQKEGVVEVEMLEKHWRRVRGVFRNK